MVIAALWGKCVSLNTYSKDKRSHIINLNFHLKKPEKEDTNMPKVSMRNKLIKVRVEVNQHENRENNWRNKKLKMNKILTRLNK
jgi:hypothetical protein